MNLTQEELEKEFARQCYLCSGLGRFKMFEILRETKFMNDVSDEEFWNIMREAYKINKNKPKCNHQWIDQYDYVSQWKKCLRCGAEKVVTENK